MWKQVLLFSVLAVSSVNASEAEVSRISTDLSPIVQSTDDRFDTPPNQTGFPIATGGSTSESCPQVVDIDDDGDLEVIIGSGTSLHAYHHDGSMMSGFPVTVAGPAYYTAAVGDIDNDGELEIAIAGQRSNLYVYRADGSLETGWPQYLGDDDGAACSPTMADLDGDGDLELIIGTFKDLNGNNGYIEARMYVFHHDGTLFSGWPVLDVDPYAIHATPAVGDIDNDGDLEIITAGRNSQALLAWHTDGTPVDGFPAQLSGLIESSPTMADIDNDGDLEIFIGTGSERVYGVHHDGSAVTGWPRNMGGGGIQHSSPSIGDIDDDGDLEIVCGSVHNNVYAWHHDGTPVTGWPQSTGTVGAFAQGTPALGDVDGDGDMEITVGTYAGLFIWHHDGSLLPWFPLPTGWSRCSATLTDLDQDGDIEILIGAMNNNLYCWDIPETYDENLIEWGTFRNSLLNTGLYEASGVGISEEPQIFNTDAANLFQNRPNPFNSSSVICYQLQETKNVTLNVYDISGKLVITLVDEVQCSGDHSVIWDGRTSSGVTVSPGIYLYRLETGYSVSTREMILIR